MAKLNRLLAATCGACLLLAACAEPDISKETFQEDYEAVITPEDGEAPEGVAACVADAVYAEGEFTQSERNDLYRAAEVDELDSNVRDRFEEIIRDCARTSGGGASGGDGGSGGGEGSDSGG